MSEKEEYDDPAFHDQPEISEDGRWQIDFTNREEVLATVKKRMAFYAAMGKYIDHLYPRSEI